MKRITTLLLAAIFALGSVGAAQADGIDVKVKGQWDFAFGWAVNSTFRDNVHAASRTRENDIVAARQRVRTQINFIAGEHLQGVLMFEIGNIEWGHNPDGKTFGRGSGGRLDADGVNVETKRAYIDWIIPHTEVSVRMGIQGLALPGVFGNPVMDADVAGILVSSPITEWAEVSVFWARPFDAFTNDGADSFGNALHWDDEMDMFGLLLPITGENWSVTPWGVVSSVGTASGFYNYLLGIPSTVNSPTSLDVLQNESTWAWWVGLNLNLNIFEPLSFKFDAMYGRLEQADFNGVFASGGTSTTSGIEIGAEGWLLAAALDYKFDWGTPGIFGWWASGDKDSDMDHDGNLMIRRMPVVGTDGGFTPTSFGFANSYGIGDDGIISNTGTGTWGVGLQIADMSFIEDLTHTFRVAYYEGTNDKEVIRHNISAGGTVGRWFPYNVDAFYLTDKDYALEVNFDHTYRIYENLTAVLELGYIHLHADKSVWGSTGNRTMDENDDAWKAQLLFQYKF